MENNGLTLQVNQIVKGNAYTYHIERILGQGSFGITYLASTSITVPGPLGNIETEIKVAVKEFFMKDFNVRRDDGSLVEMTDGSLAQNYLKKFRKEAENLAKLSHPNIVNVLEVFEANNTCYYAMQFLSGGSLDDYVKSRGGLPESEAVACIRQIGEAVQYMHDHRMLHLDLKPGNVMRSEDGRKMVLIDFGLSKQYDKDGNPESSTTIGLGTPGYAPIEQNGVRGEKDFAPQLDIYALGATFFKLLTGVTPPSSSEVNDKGLPMEMLKKKGVSSTSIEAIKSSMEPHASKRLGTVEDFMRMIAAENTAVLNKNKNEVVETQRKKTKKFLLPMLGIVAIGALLSGVFIFRPFDRTGISLGAKNLDLFVDDSVNLAAKMNIHNLDSAMFTWNTTDNQIVKVDTAGKIVGLRPGNAVVTVMAGRYSDQCVISVSKKLRSVRISKHDEYHFVGDTLRLAINYNPKDATLKPAPVWQSDNESVATIYPDGTLVALSEGVAVISAKCGSLIDKCLIRVSELNNGHAYRDLGLSVKWATMNVGASSPEQYGGYYQWAGILDVKSTGIYVYWDNCPYHHGSSSSYGWEKYNSNSSYGQIDNKSVLDLCDDAAHANWGGSWRMPTRDEFQELLDSCTWTWTTLNGKNGYEVRSKVNGNFIFLPAAGHRDGTSTLNVNSFGYYWSRSLEHIYDGYYLWFNNDSHGTSDRYRYYGQSVRAVCP